MYLPAAPLHFSIPEAVNHLRGILATCIFGPRACAAQHGPVMAMVPRPPEVRYRGSGDDLCRASDLEQLRRGGGGLGAGGGLHGGG